MKERYEINQQLLLKKYHYKFKKILAQIQSFYIKFNLNKRLFSHAYQERLFFQQQFHTTHSYQFHRVLKELFIK